MHEPSTRSEWRFAYCADCRSTSNHWRIRDRLYRCTRCAAARDLPDLDHDRSGLLEPLMPPPPNPGR